MSKVKRKSKVYELAKKRLAGIEAISPALDLGNGLTVTAFNTNLQVVADKLDAYNTLLSTADAAQNELTDQEKVLREFSERMREAVGAVYGHNSNEYEKAGGKRKSERKRRIRKKQKPHEVLSGLSKLHLYVSCKTYIWSFAFYLTNSKLYVQCLTS